MLTWDGFEGACRDLAGSVRGSGFRPDIVVYVIRGGLLPAGSVGYALDIKSLLVLNVKFYMGIRITFLDSRLVNPVPDSRGMAGKRVLIIDDVTDSGRTLKFIHEICEQYASEIRTIVLCEKPRAVLKYEYVWKRTDHRTVFPQSALPLVNSQKDSEA